MFRAASVDQKLVVEMSCLVTLSLISHVYREIFPVSLNLVMTQSINIVILRLLPLALVPTGLIRHTVVRNQAFCLNFRGGVVGLRVVVVNRLVGGFVKDGLSKTILHQN